MGTSSHIRTYESEGRWVQRKSRYSSAVIKLKHVVICNMCDRMKRRFAKVGEVKGQPIIVCVTCVLKMKTRKNKVQL